MEERYELSDEVMSSYIYLKWIDGIGWCGVTQLVFHYSIQLGITDVGYEDRWCLDNRIDAALAMQCLYAWDGRGGPPGWHKHHPSGPYRDVVTKVEWGPSDKAPVHSSDVEAIMSTRAEIIMAELRNRGDGDNAR